MESCGFFATSDTQPFGPAIQKAESEYNESIFTENAIGPQN